ncbi:hypothetical protein IHC87_06615 [Photobacterium damselae subsp. damselae]|uniref:hypothetical protein n=1 Tax=Photobacterium damselae TaxID=38293 RepID=UPI001F3ABDE2|nr:hypothetical protein [Photobacterium damselae]UJZ95012.1 hypothetical protein IHC87_06615 [Photobacterium damselae subsp. damselae]UJZ98993.1 hypothetical protein IHC88_06605 [Photobacterium damselae subsp. damselae]
MTILTQPLFIRDGQSVVNASTATTLTHNGDFTLLLDSKCKKVAYISGDSASAVFEKAKKVVRVNTKYALKLENGGFIDARIISTAFVSPKTNNLVIVGINDRPLGIFDANEFSDLTGLTEVILDGLVSVSEGKSMPTIDWSAYKH